MQDQSTWPTCKCGCGNPAPVSDRTIRSKGIERGAPRDFISGHNRGQRAPRPIAERLAEGSRPVPTGCIEWTGFRNPKGYGLLAVSGREQRRMLAHRLAWEIANGAIPDGLLVLHRCDNPPCINPAHLFLGTHQDNVADRHRKGRTPTKLTIEQVREIRALLVWGLSTSAIAERYDVSCECIRSIAQGRTWREA